MRESRRVACGKYTYRDRVNGGFTQLTPMSGGDTVGFPSFDKVGLQRAVLPLMYQYGVYTIV